VSGSRQRARHPGGRFEPLRGEVYPAPQKATPGSPEEHAARIAAHDKPGKHLWVITAAWHLSDPETDGKTTLLDSENLLMISPPGCFKCELMYSPEMAAAPCAGEPDE
jgi:hypothetical protein